MLTVVLAPDEPRKLLDERFPIPPQFQWVVPMKAAGHHIIFDHGMTPDAFRSFAHCASPIEQIKRHGHNFIYQRTRFHDMGLTQWCESGELRGRYLVRKVYDKLPPDPTWKVEVWFEDAVDAIHFKMHWF